MHPHGHLSQACGVAWTLFVTLTSLLGLHAWLCFRTSQQAKSALLMLDPVSSGLVQV